METDKKQGLIELYTTLIEQFNLVANGARRMMECTVVERTTGRLVMGSHCSVENDMPFEEVIERFNDTDYEQLRELGYVMTQGFMTHQEAAEAATLAQGKLDILMGQ